MCVISFLHICQRMYVGTFFIILLTNFSNFNPDIFLSIGRPPPNFFTKKHFSKRIQLLTNYAAEIKLWEFLNFFFQKKKIISQKSILDIFIFVHFRKVKGSFVLKFHFWKKNPFLPGFQKRNKKVPTILQRERPRKRVLRHFCHFFDQFCRQISSTKMKGWFTQNTLLTLNNEPRCLVFTHLSTNLCRDFFLHFLDRFSKKMHR